MTFHPAETPPRRFGDPKVAGAVAVITLGALAIRYYLSAGVLGNDEIWSLINLRPIHHFWGVLWGISHDNNHFLNSLWLYFVWPLSHNSSLLRSPSIIGGVAAIPLMAWLGAKSGPATALAAAALMALSFFQMTYGMQARGYATATLALIAAYGLMEEALDDPAKRRSWLLALAAGFAFLSHLAAGPILVLFSGIAFAETLRKRRALGAAIAETFSLFWPTALAMLPTVIFFAIGYVEMGGFHIGFSVPYSASHLFGAVANLEMTTFGMDPSSTPQIIFALLVAPLLILATIFLCARPERRIAYLVVIFVPPLIVLLLRQPNTHAPRYFFAASPFLLLLLAETFGKCWRSGPAPRALASLVVVASLIADTNYLVRMNAGEAATWTMTFDKIAASGEPSLASSFDFNVSRFVDFFNTEISPKTPVALIEKAVVCEKPPRWYVVELPDFGAPAPTLTVKGEGCEFPFTLDGVYDRDVPWLSPWGLYRRAG